MRANVESYAVLGRNLHAVIVRDGDQQETIGTYVNWDDAHNVMLKINYRLEEMGKLDNVKFGI